MNYAILLFIACTFANVILSTVKSVMTIKGGKVNAAIWNALAFGLYSYIVVLTATAPISTLGKVIITVGCNLIGVYCVKLVEEKMRKDKIWKIEITVPADKQAQFIKELKGVDIPFNYIEGIGKYTIFNVYAPTKQHTDCVLAHAKSIGAKTFASETTLAP